MAVSLSTFITIDQGGAPAVSAVNTARIYADSGDDTIKVSSDGGAYATIAAGATNTLQAAYNSSGAGAGRSITADSGAVTITNNAANGNNVFEVTKSPGGAQAGSGVLVTMGANATGDAVTLTSANATAAAVFRVTNGAGSLCVLGQPSTLTFGAILAPSRVLSGDARGVFQLRDTTAFGANIGPGIELVANVDAVPNVFAMATVQGCKENVTSGNNAGYFRVTTLPNGGTHTERFRVTSVGDMVVQSTSLFNWSSTASPGGTPDTAWGRVAAGVVGAFATSTTGSTIALASGQAVRISSTTDPGGAADAGIARAAANVLRSTDGSTGLGAIRVRDAGVQFNGAAVGDVLLKRNSTTLETRLGDDSALTRHRVSDLGLGATAIVRTVTSGSATATANTTTTLATFTRNTNETLVPSLFVDTNTAGVQWSWGLAVGADNCEFFFERTANANELTLKVRNTNLTTDRTVRWAVLGVVA